MLRISAMMLIAGLSCCVGCAGTGSPTSATGFCRFSGITETDADGTVYVQDSDDWCISAIPEDHRLGLAYPNPASDSVVIYFGLPQSGDVRLEILGMFCVPIRTLWDGTKSPGVHSIVWDLRNTSGARVLPGVYRCVMEAGDFTCYGDIGVLPAGQ